MPFPGQQAVLKMKFLEQKNESPNTKCILSAGEFAQQFVHNFDHFVDFVGERKIFEMSKFFVGYL